jgi:hypothetical protein
VQSLLTQMLGVLHPLLLLLLLLPTMVEAKV